MTINARVRSTQAAQKEAMEAKCIATRKRAASLMEEEEHDLNDVDPVTPPNPSRKRQAINNDSDEEDFQGVLTQKPHIGEDESSDDYDEDEGARPDDLFWIIKMSSTSTSISTRAVLSLQPKMGKRHRITLDIFPSHLLDLATAGHAVMRLHVVTQEGFPPPTCRSKFSWKRLINASKGREDLQAKLLEVNSNEEIKNMLIDYVWSAVAQVQGEIVAKAHLITIFLLLEAGAFADGDLDIKIFKDLIHNQWYGRKGEGVHYPEHFKGIPLALLAIITTAIECSLRAYVNGNKATLEFSENVFKIRNLANLHYLWIDDNHMKDKDFGIDFEALEGTVTVVEHAA
ncbi:hypothetical protein SERLA73DRAFT_70131 [Serpula lacrymans var. lacrymans S7.3]|uniref:DUF6532 domain-containing protein n=2 Tax=Serpula lacrymans var. lacrymans TaxID=341189 RepID=F8PM04_SERL3|nr:uncharacterized protein SERLADRAFT_434245 [Serpula lacrymans var. lacrymans S7.9]EGO02636.1 hypothetical protein SERLA73DRAFT_70131 [Serpula lacrymans var. lacrymans S7.3]EGO28340.1 hypothetical protein SERLADRAFT_434245 [Serpula lacrymans var. lacrymans S7.9]